MGGVLTRLVGVGKILAFPFLFLLTFPITFVLGQITSSETVKNTVRDNLTANGT